MMNGLTKVEKAFVSYLYADREAPPEFDPNDPISWERIRQLIRESAYHEAGHYVANCFTGLDLYHVVLLSIIPDKINKGRMISEGCSTEPLLGRFPPSLKQSNGRMLLLKVLAGAGAEMRVGDEADGRESILDYWEDYFSDDKDEKGTDYVKAFRIATIMEKPFMPAGRILNLADKWTMEMLAIPVVWNAVEAVAGKLLELGEIEREELVDMVYTSMEVGFKVPLYLELPKWRRRLLPK